MDFVKKGAGLAADPREPFKIRSNLIVSLNVPHGHFDLQHG